MIHGCDEESRIKIEINNICVMLDNIINVLYMNIYIYKKTDLILDHTGHLYLFRSFHFF